MQHVNTIKIKLKHANTHATNQFAKQYHETCKKYTKQKIMKDKVSKCNKGSIKKLLKTIHIIFTVEQIASWYFVG